MSLFDNMKSPSFRGVGFRLSATSGEDGRRVVKHVYPQRDRASAEDLGEVVGEFTISGYVIGRDWVSQRDALRKACREPGPGRLVHPTVGEADVVLTSAKWSETVDAFGRCDFELTFMPGEDGPSPTATEDTRSRSSSATSALGSAAATDFANLWSALGQADSVETAASTLVSKLTSALGLPTGTDGEASSIFRRLSSAYGADASASGLSSDTASLFSAYRAAAGSTGTEAGLSSAVSTFQTTAASPVAGTTPSRIQQANNHVAYLGLVERSALAERVAVFAETTFASRVEATALRDRLVAYLDRAITAAGDTGADASYRALRVARAAAVRDLTERALTLADVATFATARSRPSLVLAQRLSGADTTLARADDLAGRNRVPHPLFMPVSGEWLTA